MSVIRNRKSIYKKKLNASTNDVVYTGNELNKATVISLFDLKTLEGKPKAISLQEITQRLSSLKADDSIWINVTGLSNIDTIRALASQFGINNLLLNDIVNVFQRPKIEFGSNYVFVEADRILFDNIGGIDKAQISLLLTENVLITFSDTDLDYLTNLVEFKDAIFTKTNRKGSILFYYLIDKLVDQYFVIIDDVVEQLEGLEEEIISGSSENRLDSVIKCRKNIHAIRHSASPLKEILYSLQRSENKFYDKDVRYYLSDTYEHLIQIVETLEVNRESIISLIDIYMSGLSIKLNDIMKVLTLIATIFMPLTFIVGLYGMNFVNQPEYKWPYGYGFAWFLIIVVGLAFAWFFKKKKWF